MKYTLLTSTLVTALSATAVFASDEDVLPLETDKTEFFRNAAGWTVHKNITRQSCFISRTDDAGGAIQMGLTKDQNYGYLGAFVKDFDVEEGDKEVAILVNGNLYVGTSTGTNDLSGNYKGGYVLVDNKNFVKDIEASDELIAYPDAPYQVILKLEGAKTALYEARKCMEEFAEN